MIEVDDPLWEMLHPTSRVGDGEEGGRCAPPTCTHCSSATSAIASAEGNLVCTGCFSVVDRMLDYGAEWRYYGAEDPRGANPTRCCPPSNGLITTLGSVISAGPRRRASQWVNRTEANAASAQASCAAGRAVQRYQVWNALTYRERVLCGIFDVLAVNAAQNALPACILEEAKSIYKRVSDVRITRGENRTAVIACSIYVACRKNGVPRSLKEVGAMFDVRPAAMTKAYRAFGFEEGADACPAADDFVGRFCSRLGLDETAVAMVRDIVARADADSIVCDAMPTSIAAGAIAVVSEALGLGLTREAIAAVSVLAPVTVAKLAARLKAGGLGGGSKTTAAKGPASAASTKTAKKVGPPYTRCQPVSYGPPSSTP